MLNDGTTITTYTYSTANRLQLANAAGALTTYTYDLAGNRTGQQSATDSTYFAWDAAGRMISAEPMVGTITLTYNADGQRTAKQGTDGSATGYLYDYKHLLHETDEVGGDIFNTYASTTQEEFGDLIGEDTVPYYHQPCRVGVLAHRVRHSSTVRAISSNSTLLAKRPSH